MPDVHSLNRRTSVFVNHICWITAEDHLYTLDKPDVEDYYYLSPHIYMEEHYYGKSTLRTRSLLSAGRRLTAGDLALIAMESLSENAEQWDVLILAQTYPDRYAMNPPLARILESTSWKVDYPLAFSHLGALAGLEGIQAARWTLMGDQRGALVLTEQRVLESGRGFLTRQGCSQTGVPGERSDMAVALDLSKETGALEVDYMGKVFMNSAEGRSISEKVSSILEELMNSCQANHVIVQSSLASRICIDGEQQLHPVKTFGIPHRDYQSGDVWIQLGEQLQNGSIRPGERVLLVAWDGGCLLSASCAFVTRQPNLSKLPLHSEVGTT
ncbi:hypothetical protein [Paenibacillus sp. P13VS]|uniref:hypothetical protein n=1 Tax=Paenibacillus sp. P13VS TaxID=2697367 RepID=UPI00187BB46B|nr:hypothetical protein [Paenibacillus sp. P13VS]MBE7683769.1 hypothetical protein [Paenibacillus sp. P13VS]